MLVVLLGRSGALLDSGAASIAPKNIVLIIADDLTRDISCYGNDALPTPNIDRLAAQGTRFTHAFCTTASCSPSRSVLFTGRHNHANGMYGLAHAAHHFASFDGAPNLFSLLSSNAYRTARIGKFHVQPESTYRADIVLSGNQGGDRNPVSMAERCREFLSTPSNQPFFLLFATSDPHRSALVNSNIAERPNRFGNGPRYEGITETLARPADVRVPRSLPDTATCRAELAEYRQSVIRFDQGVGRLLQVLQETGHFDTTLIVLLSDNGIPFPGAKTTLYEPGIRLPLIVRRPNHPRPGSINEAMVSWVDIAPTLLEFAGVRFRPADFHGRSFLSSMSEPNPAGWDHVYLSHTFHEVTMYYPMRGIRTRRYKYIENLAHPLSFPFASDLWDSATWQETLTTRASTYGQRSVAAYLNRPPIELYDLESDPDEVRNLASQPDHAPRLAEFRNQLESFQKRTRDPWLIKRQHE